MAHREFAHDSCENCGASYINQFDPETGAQISPLHECPDEGDDEEEEEEEEEVNLHSIESKADALRAIKAYEANPDGVDTCDLLCDVADWLDLPEGEYHVDELREMIADL